MSNTENNEQKQQDQVEKILDQIDWTGYEDVKQELEQFIKLPKEQRDQLTRKTMESLVRSLNIIASERNRITKLRLMKKLGQELEKNRAKIIVRLTYMIKPEFRDLAIKLAKALTRL